MTDNRYARLAGWKQRKIDRMVGTLAQLSTQLVESQRAVAMLTDAIARERAHDMSGMDGLRQDWIRIRRMELFRSLARVDCLHRQARQLRKDMIDAQGELDGLKNHIQQAARKHKLGAARAEQVRADESAIAAHWRGSTRR